MTEEMKALFTPYQIGKLSIKNRYAMGPMGATSLFDPNYAMTDRGIEYYVERAKGGFGLITTGVMIPDVNVDKPNLKVNAGPLYNPVKFRDSMVRLTDRIRAYDTKIFAQLSMGVGRNYPFMTAPSSVEVFNYPDMKSIEITKDQIKMKEEAVFEAAKLMKNCNMHGIEIHALHWGYLLDQFAMSITNHREDEYGGTLENRLRVCKELVEGIKSICGADFPVTMRLGLKSYIKSLNKASLTGEDEAGRTLEEGIRICKLLEEYGYDALSVDTGVYDSFYYACPPCYMPKGHALPLYAEAKKAVNIPILAGSRMGDPYICAKALKEGMADAFVLSRPALADPNLPKKVEVGTPEKIRPCIGCNMGCIGRHLDLGLPQTCAVNPRALHEIETKPKKAVVSKNIMVVGGGVAGMEAARTAAMCGHTVELYEKSDRLGGELIAAGAHSFKSEIYQLNDWYQLELKDLHVPVYKNVEVTADMVKERNPDAVIIAMGASPLMPKSIKGIDSSKAVSAVDVLEGHAKLGENVVVIGGGMVGCESAVDFAIEGKKVTLVEALDNVLSSEYVPIQHTMMLKDMMEQYNVDVKAAHKLIEINDEGAVVQPVYGGEAVTVKADTVVLAIGLKPNASLASDLRGCGIEVYEVGSVKKAGNIINSVHDAFEVAYNLE